MHTQKHIINTQKSNIMQKHIAHSNTELYKGLSNSIEEYLNNNNALTLESYFAHHYKSDGSFTYTWCITLSPQSSEDITDEEFNQFTQFNKVLINTIKQLTNNTLDIANPIPGYNPDCLTPIFAFNKDYSVLIQENDLTYTITLNEYAY